MKQQWVKDKRNVIVYTTENMKNTLLTKQVMVQQGIKLLGAAAGVTSLLICQNKKGYGRVVATSETSGEGT